MLKDNDIITITNVYSFGSIGKLVENIHTGFLENGYKSIVLFGRKKTSNPAPSEVYKICSEFESYLSHFLASIFKTPYSFNLFSTFKTISFIKKHNPKVIFVHAINDFFINPYILFRFLKKRKITTYVVLHSGCLFFANCGGNSFECPQWIGDKKCMNCPLHNNQISRYLWRKMDKTLQGFNSLSYISVSPFLMKISKQSEIIRKHPHFCIFNGVGDEFKFVPTTLSELNLPLYSKTAIFVVPSFFNKNKGYAYLEKLAHLNSNVLFVCISLDGKTPKTSLNNIFFTGPIKNKEMLAKYYSVAGVALVLSKSETFSMPTAEALCCGTPVVGFKAGGPEDIALEGFSSFVPYGEINSLSQKMNELFEMQYDKQTVSSIARTKYSSKKMVEDYINILKATNID